MPGFADGDYYLADSSAIIHYLEAKHPDPEMIPADPELRGHSAVARKKPAARPVP